MLWVVAAAVVGLIVFGVAAALTGRAEPMAEMPHDGRPSGLPANRLASAEELRDAQFDLAFRGYRMAEVDALLDRLADEVAVRDAEIARLNGHPENADQRPAEEASDASPEQHG